METPRSKAQRDQDLAEAVDTAPRIYRALFLGFLEQGFTTDQSMRLLIAMIQKPSNE